MKSIQEIGRKFGEAAKRHPWRTGVASVATLSLAAAEVVGYAQNPTYDIPDDACISQPALSQPYNGNPFANPLQWYSGLLTPGVVASGTLPEGAYGVQASYRHPAEGQSELQSNASDMVVADGAGRYALKMTIGKGDVEFAVSIVAPRGSELCTSIPAVDYDYKDMSDYLNARGDLPWPIPLNVPFNLEFS